MYLDAIMIILRMHTAFAGDWLPLVSNEASAKAFFAKDNRSTTLLSSSSGHWK